MSRPVKLVLAVLVGAVVLVTGGTWAYIHVIRGDPPAPLTLGSTATATTVAGASTDATVSGTSTAPSAGGDPGSVDGTWKVATGSQAGYRVKEVLFGQSATAVGRTSAVTGSVDIAGTTVKAADFSVDLTTVASDESRRDRQFQGRIMETSTYPTARFKLTSPIDVGTLPPAGTQVKVNATGELTLHGTTKTVTVPLQVQRSGATVRVAGTIPIVFADYGIPNPSAGPASTEDHGEIEFLLALAK